jgi:hypothetical protein
MEQVMVDITAFYAANLIATKGIYQNILKWLILIEILELRVNYVLVFAAIKVD